VLQLAPVSFNDVVTSVVQALSGSVGRRRIDVSVSIPDGLDVIADEKALEQVVVNLVDNAIKYGAEGGRIDIVGAFRNGRVRVEVCDDGPGIAPHHRERIFERFYRVEPGRSRAVGGTGLGLSIVKHLAEAMHGAVGVESRSPTGSVFWVELPAAGPTEPVAGPKSV
jgi:two-component system phosphate regulon sensor histidine kinase PhoR